MKGETGNMFFWLYTRFCHSTLVNTGDNNLYHMYSHNEGVVGMKFDLALGVGAGLQPDHCMLNNSMIRPHQAVSVADPRCT